ncbi:hypothetical protein TNCV_2847771 [Trichonephila clavipes]|nr:hypothetical protein TNCV_2847771 [Trichonephila clavipes]
MACDAEDRGFQMLNDHEIVTSMHEKSNPVDEETDEDEDNNNNESSKGPSNDYVTLFCVRDSHGVDEVSIRQMWYVSFKRPILMDLMASASSQIAYIVK